MPKPNFFPIIPPISPADARSVKNDDGRTVWRGETGTVGKYMSSRWLARQGRQRLAGTVGNAGAPGGFPDREGTGRQGQRENAGAAGGLPDREGKGGQGQ